MSQRVKTSARALVLTRSSQPENGHLRKKRISFRRTFYWASRNFHLWYQRLYFLNVWGFFLAQDQTTRLFWLVLIFSTFLFVNVYRCSDICRGKTNSRTISEPSKNNSGLHTTDANLELTVHVYDLVIS